MLLHSKRAFISRDKLTPGFSQRFDQPGQVDVEGAHHGIRYVPVASGRLATPTLGLADHQERKSRHAGENGRVADQLQDDAAASAGVVDPA